MLEDIFQGGLLTVFAYGQTGSGKTYTMQGLEDLSIGEIYEIRNKSYPDFFFELSFFEIYGGRCFDLLNNKNKVQILEGNDNTLTI